jgi:hypothetical protein
MRTSSLTHTYALNCISVLESSAGRAGTRTAAYLTVGRALASHPAPATVTMALTYGKEATP